MSYAHSKQEGLKRNENIGPHNNLYTNASSSLIYNHPNPDVLSGEWTHTLWHTHRQSCYPGANYRDMQRRK